MAMYAGFDHALRLHLKSAGSSPVEFYTEYLDLMRFAGPVQREKSVDYLRAKYAGPRIDLIVTVGSLAFDFILEHGDTIFPDIPIVFASVNASRIAQAPLKENVTGVAVERDVRQTVDLLLAIQPDVQQIVIPIGSSPTEKEWAEDTRQLFKPYEKRVRVEDLSDLSMDAMLRRLSALPAHSAVLFTTVFYYDAAGSISCPTRRWPASRLDRLRRYSVPTKLFWIRSGRRRPLRHYADRRHNRPSCTASARRRQARQYSCRDRQSEPSDVRCPPARTLENPEVPSAGWKRDQIRGDRDLGQIQGLYRRCRVAGRVPGGAHRRPDRDERQTAARRNLASREPCPDPRSGRPPDHRAGAGAVANRTGTARRCLSTDGTDRNGVDAPGKNAARRCHRRASASERTRPCGH